MASAELDAGAWLARGIEAYQEFRVAAAAEHFEKAIALDSQSLAAYLALGAARLTLYVRRPQPLVAYLLATREISLSELDANEEKANTILAEQNLTNWPLAEQSLIMANQLDPQNALVVEYLCALYFHWKNPLDQQDARSDEALHWLNRLLELEPEHRYANYHYGLILLAKAERLLPNYGRYPPLPEPDSASRRSQAGLLLEEANRHFARDLSLHGDQTAAGHFLETIASRQAYLAGTASPKFPLHLQMPKSLPTPALSSSPAAITFTLSPEALAEDMERPFPPNPWRIGVGPAPL